MLDSNVLLDEKARLIDEHRRDIEAIDRLLARLVINPAAPSTASPATLAAPPTEAKEKMVPRRRTIDPSEPAREGTIRYWIEKAFGSANPERVWTAPAIHDWAKTTGVEFGAGRDRAIQSIGLVLMAMVEAGMLKRVWKGAGRNPSRFTWAASIPASAQQFREVGQG